jgi:hypothetical protein
MSIFPYGVQAQPRMHKALMVYDQTKEFGQNQEIVKILQEQIETYSIEMTSKQMTQYQPGECFQYDDVFVVGIKGELNNPLFFEDLQSYEGTLCWIGKGIQYIEHSKFVKDLKIDGDMSNFVRVQYKDTIFPADSTIIHTIISFNDAEQEVYCYLDNGAEKKPSMLKKDQFIYITNIAVNQPSFDIFFDIFPEAFEVSPMNLTEDKKNQLESINNEKSVFHTISLFFIGIFTVVCCSFACIFFYSRRERNKNLFQRRKK